MVLLSTLKRKPPDPAVSEQNQFYFLFLCRFTTAPERSGEVIIIIVIIIIIKKIVISDFIKTSQ